MKIFTLILNALLLLILILSFLEGDWQGEDMLYFPLFIGAPITILYVIIIVK